MHMNAPLLLDLPPDIRHALRARAKAYGIAPATLARQVLAQAFATPLGTSGNQPLLAPLRALLAADLARAVGWDDLQGRMQEHGYTFRERGGGLALYCTKTAAHICKASDLGWSYSDLMRRFEAPFPGHGHTWLTHRVLRSDPSAKPNHPDLFGSPDDTDIEDNDDIILIEPF